MTGNKKMFKLIRQVAPQLLAFTFFCDPLYVLINNNNNDAQKSQQLGYESECASKLAVARRGRWPEGLGRSKNVI